MRAHLRRLRARLGAWIAGDRSCVLWIPSPGDALAEAELITIGRPA